MEPKILRIVIIQTVIFKALTSQVQPSIKQYLHLTGVGPNSPSSGLCYLPTVGVTSREPPAFTSVPSSGLPAFSAVSLPSLLSGVPTSQGTERQLAKSGLPTLSTTSSSIPYPNLPSSDSTKSDTGTLDSSVLNNLAIALQLLIVSNILNMPLSESEDKSEFDAFEAMSSFPATSKSKQSSPVYELESKPCAISFPPASNSIHPSPSISYQPSNPSYVSPTSPTPSYESYFYETSSPSPSYYSPQSVPNAKFVGSSSFVDSSPMLGSLPSSYGSYGSSTSNPRTSLTLMSPYEALAPNSPYSDPILSSPYGPVGTKKKDFQSPYSAILGDNNDLFSINDLF